MLPIPVDLAISNKRSCVLFDSGDVKCFGNNDDGRLGLGDTEHRGDDPDEMGNSLPFIDFGGRAVKQIDAGEFHTCVLFDTVNPENGFNEVVCFGKDTDGIHTPLGRGFTSAFTSESVGDNPEDMGTALRAVPLLNSAVSLTCGRLHSCAVLDIPGSSSGIRCWGRNENFKLGFTRFLTSALFHLNIGEDCRNGLGTCIPPVQLDDNAEVIQVAAGQVHTCALFSDKRIKCWGERSLIGLEMPVGNVLNESTTVADLPFVDIGPDMTPLSIHSKFFSTCVIVNTTTGATGMKCFGLNVANTLGIGTDVAISNNNFTETIGDAPGEMGSNLRFVPLGTGVEVHDVAMGPSHVCVIISTPLARRRLKCYGLVIGYEADPNVSPSAAILTSDKMGMYEVDSFEFDGDDYWIET